MRATSALLLAIAALSQATALKANPKEAKNSSAEPAGAKLTANETMIIRPRQFMEVSLGPFATAAEACDYCFTSFTKEGVPPAGPVAPACVCMAYPDEGGHNMFCATPVSAAGYIAEKNGCLCKARDMQNMGSTTCSPIK